MTIVKRSLDVFVPITPQIRSLILVYFMGWRVLPAASVLMTPTSSGQSLLIAIAAVSVATQLLLLAPFVFRRFAGSPVGWTHPLVLSSAVAIFSGILRNPLSLLGPFLILQGQPGIVEHPLLQTWSVRSVLAANLKFDLMVFIGLASTYAGFSIIRRRLVPVLQPPWNISNVRVSALLAVMIVFVIYFLQIQGGILQHFAGLGAGRFTSRETAGEYFVVAKFLPYLLIFWYVLSPSLIKSPLFIGVFAFVCALQFAVTGSRSGLFVPVEMLLAAWMLLNQRIPLLRALAIGAVAVILLGSLGEVRRSSMYGELDFSPLANVDFVASYQLTQEELAKRDIGTGVAVAALVPRRRDFLLGETYVAALGFWIPRALWSEKPRGIGAYTAALLYQGRRTTEGYRGAAFSTHASAEAYWNFGWPGVVLIGVLFGVALRLIADWRIRRPDSAAAIMAVLLVGFVIPQPTTVALVDLFQTASLLAVVFLMARVRRRFDPVRASAGLHQSEAKRY